jgi:hypothetical protein
VNHHEYGSLDSENEFDKLKIAGTSSNLLFKKPTAEDNEED